MYYVYILRSVNFPKQTYRGYTEDLKARIKAHNAGKSTHTAKYLPWELEVIMHLLTNKKPVNLNII